VIVTDTNVLVRLVLPSAESDLVVRLFAREPGWVAPRLVRSEVLSVLSKQGPLVGLDGADADEAFAIAMEALEDATLEPEPGRVLHLASRSGCSSYDCEYVATAEALGCHLATWDRQVLRAFPSIARTPQQLLAPAGRPGA
jgi:predicted nucleic acid-binding protein